MALNWVRGFRRLGWVFVALGGILAAFVAADFSKEVVGFDPELIKTNFPDNLLSAALTVKLLEFEKAQNDSGQSNKRLRVVCEDSGFKNLPDVDKLQVLQLNSLFSRLEPYERDRWLRESGIQIDYDQIAALVRATAHLDKIAVEAARELYDVPYLRSHGRFPQPWQVEIRRVNRTKFVGYVSGTLVVFSILVQGGISLVAWVARGFRG